MDEELFPQYTPEEPKATPDAAPPVWMRPMELSREEYVRFQMLLSRTAGALRFQKAASIMFLVMALMCIAAIVYVSIKMGGIDWVTVMMMGVMIALGALILGGVPAYLRFGARQAYDQTVSGGGDFYGYVRVTPQYIEKETVTGTFRVPFNSASLYLEDTDMMVFMTQGVPKGIVLPARCLTAEDTAYLRACVFGQGVSLRKQVRQPLIPLAAQPLPVRPLAESEERELLRLEVQYTEEEFLRLGTDTSWRRFYKVLPFYLLIAVLCGTVIAWLEESIGMALLIVAVMLTLLAVSGVLLPRARLKRMLAATPAEKLRQTVLLTDRGVVTLSWSGEELGRFGWSAIKRAVETPSYVELFLRGGFLRIPKTCVPDMDGLRRIVDAHRPAVK